MGTLPPRGRDPHWDWILFGFFFFDWSLFLNFVQIHVSGRLVLDRKACRVSLVDCLSRRSSQVPMVLPWCFEYVYNNRLSPRISTPFFPELLIDCHVVSRSVFIFFPSVYVVSVDVDAPGLPQLVFH